MIRSSFWALVATLALACTASADEKPSTLQGATRVIDADTIEIQGERIRLNGFDAPESGSSCGGVDVYEAGAQALTELIGTRTVSCVLKGNDGRGRHVATCAADGQEIGEFIVSAGWGRDWPRYSEGAYADEEKAAREAGAGIWGLDCADDLWGNRNYD